MTLLRDLPAVQTLAEDQAKRLVSALVAVGCVGPWERWYPGERAQYVAAHLDRICDLTDPASMDALARLVAAKVGLVCGATAPRFYRSVAIHSDWGGAKWVLEAGGIEVTFADSVGREWKRAHSVPGISAITDPAEALTRIALTVLA